MTLRRELCDALDAAADLVVPGDKLELISRLCDQVMAEAPADEELCRAGSDAPYLRRWWLRRAAAAEQSSEAVYLHEILEPDAEPPHNYPWDSAALVVAGSLTDEQHLPGGGRNSWSLERGDVFYRPASHCHLLTPHPAAITLFATGARRQPWGFLRPDGTFGRDGGEHALRGRRASLEHPQTV